MPVKASFSTMDYRALNPEVVIPDGAYGESSILQTDAIFGCAVCVRLTIQFNRDVLLVLMNF